jgi:hypothetical protein
LPYSICVVGQDAELRNGIEIGDGAGTGIAHLLYENAVEDERIGRLAHAVDGERSGVQVSGNGRYRESRGDERTSIRSGEAGRARDHAGLEREQICVAAGYEGNGGHLSAFYDLAHLRADCLHVQGVGGDLYLLAHLPYLQHRVHGEGCVDVEHEVVLLIFLKSLLCHGEHVGSQGKGLKGVEALTIGNAGFGDARTGVGGGHGRTGYGRSAHVLHCSRDAGGDTGKYGDADEQGKNECKDTQ